MRSVTDQLNSASAATDNGVDPQPGDPRQLAELIESAMPQPVVKSTPEEERRTALANAKLKVAYATRGTVAKATGVGFASPGHTQMQEIFDDGSVRNPYKMNREISGRQRKRMRKLANRNMKARGLKGKIEDVLKGRRVGTPERPQPETTQSPVPANDPHTVVGMPVAAILGD